MINLLLDGRFNCKLKRSDYNYKNDIFINEFNISELIRNTLVIAAEKGELINTQGLRGIGKTYELVRFAKENGYAVISLNVDYIKETTGYDLVYSSVNQIKNFKLKGIVVDELVNAQDFKDSGFNVVTGYYTETNNNKSLNENIVDTLKNEIKCLTPKIEKARENNEFGTYKNLILAYKEVLQLLNYVQENKINIK